MEAAGSSNMSLNFYQITHCHIPEDNLYIFSAGTTAVSEPEHKSVRRPAPTTTKETNAADITGGTCLLHNGRLPLLY
jgi:hypothetical protein